MYLAHSVSRIQRKLPVRRRLLGLISLAFLGFASIVCVFPSLANYQPASLMAIRIGIVLGVLWLAWPDWSVCRAGRGWCCRPV